MSFDYMIIDNGDDITIGHKSSITYRDPNFVTRKKHALSCPD